MDHMFRRVCVYCGSNSGTNPEYSHAAAKLGRFLAKREITLVYGGGNVGLMGVVAHAALEAGGDVVGVIPKKLESLEIGHDELTKLYVVDNMHCRKAKMAELSDAFIALPGGFGTLEETFEVITLSLLNYHFKPIGLLNVDSYYDHLIEFVQHAVEKGFIRSIHGDLLKCASTPEELLVQLAATEIPRIEKWIGQA